MLTAPNVDSVTPTERLHPVLARFLRWPTIDQRLAVWPAAVCLVIALGAIQDNVRQREVTAEQRERFEAQIETLEKMAVMCAPAPERVTCNEYGIHMERWTLVHCTKPGLRM